MYKPRIFGLQNLSESGGTLYWQSLNQDRFEKITIRASRFSFPSQHLINAYEARKKGYMETRFKEFEEKLTGRSKGEGEGIPLTCHNCGYTWNYTGFLRLATCSNCGSKVYIAEERIKTYG